VDVAIGAFEELDDERGLAWAWSLRASIYLRWGNVARFGEAAGRAVEHARRADLPREEIDGLRALAWAILIGPLPVADAVARCEAIRDRVRGASPAEQDVAGVLAVLQARRGRFDEARELIARALAELEDRGLDDQAAVGRYRLGLVDALAGDLAASERSFRRALALVPREGGPIRAQAAAALARVVVEQGRPEEALELAAVAERDAAPEDLPTQVEWRAARARAFAALERFAEAESLARIAVRLAEQTDAAPVRGEALLDLAQVRWLAGRANEALSVARRALRGFERRGAEAHAALARDVLDRFSIPEVAAERRRDAPSGPAQRTELPEAPANPDSASVWARPS
jgi:tetratricopeptide (TPR) repeat protein